MERRRFFPSKRVQQVPGRTVELDLRLKPEAAAPVVEEAPAPGNCACEVDGVAWLGDWGYWAQDASQPDVVEVVPAPNVGFTLPPGSRVNTVKQWLTGAYMPIPAMGSDEWGIESTWAVMRGVVMGTTLCDISWHWTLDPDDVSAADPDSWWEGLEVTEQSGTLLVRVMPGQYLGEQPWWTRFRATATCGGQSVGTLELRPGFNLWNTVAGLPPIAP